MKFISSVVLTLGLSSAALSSPILEKKQTTIASSVNNTLTTLQSTVNTYAGAINTAVGAAKGSFTAELHLIAAIGLNLSSIATAIQNAEGTLAAATSGGVNAISSTLQSQAQTDINTLEADADNIQILLNGIKGTLTATVSSLPPLIMLAVGSELLAIKAALATLTSPLNAFVTALGQVAGGSLSVAGVTAAITGLAGLIVPTFSGITGFPF